MSEGYTIDADDETAGIVVRYEGERGFRFHSASRTFDALDGHVFVTPAAAERAAREFAQARASRAALRRAGARYAREELAWLWQSGQRRWIPYAAVYELGKFAGLQLGLHHRRLPGSLTRRLSAYDTG